MMSMSIIVHFSLIILQSLAIFAKVLPSISSAPPENLLKISFRSLAGAGGTTSRFADHSRRSRLAGVLLRSLTIALAFLWLDALGFLLLIGDLLIFTDLVNGTYYFAEVLGYGRADLGDGLALKEASRGLGSNMFKN